MTININDLTIGQVKELTAMMQPTLAQAATTSKVPPAERAVVVTTAQRGVFFGYATDVSGDTIELRAARNCYYWSATKNGVLGLASEGPGRGSKIGGRANIELRNVTCVMECTDAAVEAWEAAVWAE